MAGRQLSADELTSDHPTWSSVEFELAFEF
jgi:hypothetical protein